MNAEDDAVEGHLLHLFDVLLDCLNGGRHSVPSVLDDFLPEGMGALLRGGKDRLLRSLYLRLATKNQD